MFDEVRITVEIVSVIICFILVMFMIKPFRLTRESRYLGLPLGFIFLGTSYAIAAIAYTEPINFFNELLWIQFLTRTFAFVFLATTYYFSEKPSKGTRLLWNITISLLVVAIIALFLLIVIDPQAASNGYAASQLYVRIFNVICLSYIAIHSLRSHIKDPDPKTVWTPVGFMLLAISQYSLLFWYADSSFAAFWGSLVLRSLALAVFLFIVYQTFCGSRKMDP